MKQFEMNIENHGVVSVTEGSTYADLAKLVQQKYEPKIMAFQKGNKLIELAKKIESDESVKAITLGVTDGVRIYQRTLIFVLVRAAMELFDGVCVRIEHSLSQGLYCEFDCIQPLSRTDVEALENRMVDIIKADELIEKEQVGIEDAKAIFAKHNMTEKVKLLAYRSQDYINLYRCGWFENYFYGYMLPSTGWLEDFGLIRYDDGVILRHPTPYSPMEVPVFIESPKIAEIFREGEEWGDITGINYVANLNDVISEHKHEMVINMVEALHEKKIASIADKITGKKKRVILIAGPSSSGKTTFANRLKIHLKVNGLNPITISTDDYFVDRSKTPLDENGKYDFESIRAVDCEQFNEDLNKLLSGESVVIPTFDFHEGKRIYVRDAIQLVDNQPIIIEGIHGLNEELTQRVFKKDKYKIYISALTQLNIDTHNRIPTTDSRLLRRIVRDSQFRGHTASKTIDMWPSVRRGEERNIFPYQEEADVIFNSAMSYELAILKKHAEPLLKEITSDQPEYIEANRLLKFLSYFESIAEDDWVPRTSILKEFIGGSSFEE